MNDEQLKDIRLMLDMISKDLSRLSDDVKCLSLYLIPKEGKDNVENVRHKGTLQNGSQS